MALILFIFPADPANKIFCHELAPIVIDVGLGSHVQIYLATRLKRCLKKHRKSLAKLTLSTSWTRVLFGLLPTLDISEGMKGLYSD